MEYAGLSAALGAFIAGALLADSEYRHQIEADIAPFEGLLLGLFFIAIGMSLDLGLLGREPLLLIGLVAGLFAIKATILYALGRWQGLDDRAARRLALVLWQGGEFAFVLFSAGVMSNVLGRELADLLTVAVTLSMALTPVLLLIQDLVSRRDEGPAPEFDTPPEEEGHVIVAGFGRFGQIVARVLRARGVPFTALDVSAEQVDFVSRFGAKIYYGDASRLDILRAAQADKARAFVLAIDDVNASLQTAETVRRHFPDLPIYARARNRQHVYALMDLGVRIIRRETFLSALDLTREVLRGLGEPEAEVKRLVDTFQRHDEARLIDDYQDRSDAEKMRLRALSAAMELEELFQKDVEEQPTPEPRPLRAAE
jgi:voltage-gated potassium channel Kch